MRTDKEIGAKLRSDAIDTISGRKHAAQWRPDRKNTAAQQQWPDRLAAAGAIDSWGNLQYTGAVDDTKDEPDGVLIPAQVP